MPTTATRVIVDCQNMTTITETYEIPDPTPEELAAQAEAEALKLREEAKIERAAAIAAIKVTVSTGKVFDGDESSQTRMSRAIIGMQAANVPTIQWTLADNSVVDVTIAEITEALILAGQKQAELWPIS